MLVQVIIAVNLRLLRRPLQNRREFIGAEGVKLVSMYFFGGAGRISDRESCLKTKIKSYLDEANVGSLLAEALTADVEAVLADQTSGVGADAAEYCVSHRVLVSWPVASGASNPSPRADQHGALALDPAAYIIGASSPSSI